MNQENISQNKILSRAIWLAFSNSFPVGMGFFQAGEAVKQDEGSLFAKLQESIKKNPDGSIQIYLDYCLGRMMKTKFKVDAQNNLSISPEVPHPEYQSWAKKYIIAQDLVEATLKSLE